MDKILIINIVIMVLLSVVLGLLWYKGKKDLVKKILRELVAQTEEKYLHGENEAKYNAVLDVIVRFINQFWIFRLFVTRDKLKKWIDETVVYMQALTGTTAERKATVKKIAIELAEKKVQELAEKAVSASYEGNVNLTDNKTIIDLNNEIVKKISADFEGVYANLKTGFTKKSTTAEIGIVKRF